MVLSEIFRGNNEVREAARAGVQIDTVSVASASDAASAADGSGKITGAIRPSAVAGSFYPADRTALKQLINQQLDYGRKLLQQLEPTLPAGVPRAVIVPHAGYIYSGTAAALAYALLERGRGSVTRAVIVGPTHRVAVRGVACSTAAAFETPLGTVPVDIAAERKALGLSVNEPLRSGTHARPGAPASRNDRQCPNPRTRTCGRSADSVPADRARPRPHYRAVERGRCHATRGG